MKVRHTFKYHIRYSDWKNRTRFEFAMSLFEAEDIAKKIKWNY